MPGPATMSVQGPSLFEDTEFGEELSHLGGISADCLGTVRSAGGPEEADRRIPDGGHDLGAGSFSDPARVVIEGDIAHVMGTILDRPMASCPSEQLTSACELPRSTGDEVASLT